MLCPWEFLRLFGRRCCIPPQDVHVFDERGNFGSSKIITGRMFELLRADASLLAQPPDNGKQKMWQRRLVAP
jgi:hypothetical protein